MELGAFVVVPGGKDFTAIREVQPHDVATVEKPRPLYCSRMPIVGNDVLQSWMDRIRKLGVKSLWLTSGRPDGTVTRSELAGFAQQGVKRLLVIKLNSYAEMDLVDLVRFHCEKRNPVTEAQDARGLLGVSLLDHLALRAPEEKQEDPSAAIHSGRMAYQFSGYAKRILSANERQELVGDALTGACGMRPFGKQISEQVWVGEGVDLASSARFVGPTYIGERTVIRAGATIGPFASVERDCVVDCGTTIERSTVMPQTYLAPGLLIRDGVVDGGYLEHLGWGIVADLRPAGLGSRIPQRELRRPASCEVPHEVYAPTSKAPVWDFTSSSAATQAWLQVQL
ncbi:MAG: hypothetical protein WAN76_18785 [Candidatus Sulfotelmatobacter sp.]